MPYYVCESNSDGTINLATVKELWPGPSAPSYGDRVGYTVQETDGGGVRQRSKLSARELSWDWHNYGPAVPKWETLYWYLFGLQSHVRKKAGKCPYVFLKETVTLKFGKFNATSGRIEGDWIRVLVTALQQDDPTDGGNVRFPKTSLKFLIRDPAVTELV